MALWMRIEGLENGKGQTFGGISYYTEQYVKRAAGCNTILIVW